MVLVGIGVAVWLVAVHVIGFVLGFPGTFGSLARVSWIRSLLRRVLRGGFSGHVLCEFVHVVHDLLDRFAEGSASPEVHTELPTDGHEVEIELLHLLRS